MKIALVILHADPARGGAERYTLDLAAALGRRGHEVRILATSFSDAVSATMRVSLDAPGITRARQYKHFLDSLDRHLDETKYDIVHAMLPVRRCDLYHPHAGIAAEATTKWSSAFNARRRVMAQVERELLTSKNPPIVLVLSDYVKGFVLKHYSLPDEKLQRLFNAVDLDRFAPYMKSSGQNGVRALMLANDFERKGLHEAILGMTRLRNEPISLEVFGKEKGERYRNLAASLRAKVTISEGRSDPRPLYESADVFVLPTRHDPCSLVVLEALAMGLPVISTKFNGATEIMADGVHGFILPDPTDIDALAAAMRKMLDPQLRKKMSEACLELRPQLSYETHLDNLLAIYATVTGKKI